MTLKRRWERERETNTVDLDRVDVYIVRWVYFTLLRINCKQFELYVSEGDGVSECGVM